MVSGALRISLAVRWPRARRRRRDRQGRQARLFASHRISGSRQDDSNEDGFHLLDRFNVQAGDQRRRDDPGRRRQARPRRARRPISARASRHAGRGRKARSDRWQDGIRARSSETPDDDSRSAAPYLGPHLSGTRFCGRTLRLRDSGDPHALRLEGRIQTRQNASGFRFQSGQLAAGPSAGRGL